MNTPLPIHNAAVRRAVSNHPRLWRENRYVYAVLSRRSKGVSIGVNLNPDKVCNFDCVYCSIERKAPPPAWASRHVDLGRLREELGAMLELAETGAIYATEPFEGIPEGLRRVNDVAFSGDGEPTTCPEFRQAVEVAAEGGGACGGGGGAEQTGADHERVDVAPSGGAGGAGVSRRAQRGNLGETGRGDGGVLPRDRPDGSGVWADSAERDMVLPDAAHGDSDAADEGAWEPPHRGGNRGVCARLGDIRNAGGKIKLVQVYTVARGTAEPYVSALKAEELEVVAALVRKENFPVEIYP